MSPKRPGIGLIVRQRLITAIPAILLMVSSVSGQSPRYGFWDRPDSLDRTRFWTAATTGAVLYTGTIIALNDAWYKDYPRTSFHTFDDSGEWLQMDKAGHAFSAYTLADWSYGVLRWTGMPRRNAIWAGMGASMLFMTSLEVLDGHSSQWGFSWSDMAANTAGAGIWGLQQAVWNEQRIRLKLSAHHQDYPDDPIYGIPGGATSLRHRADDLFGVSVVERLLKDYNAQTIWLSGNISAFLSPEGRFPKWLNIAIGYGADNVFGGRSNTWMEGDNTFSLSAEEYPRYRQWYVGPDIDLSRIRTRSKPLRFFLGMLNVIKFPAPALVFSREEGVEWTWIAF